MNWLVVAPRAVFSSYLTNYSRYNKSLERLRTHEERSVTDKHYTTLSGGSLGSCVDEERSQLREVM